MQSLHGTTYLRVPHRSADPLALLVGLAGIAVVVMAVGNFESMDKLLDLRSLLIVVVGTGASVLVQYDFATLTGCVGVLLQSFRGTPDAALLGTIAQVDEAIVNKAPLTSLRDGQALDHDLLNDVVYMHNQGLLFEEIDAFVASRIAHELLARQNAAIMLRRAARVAPALGLFGTVVGLIGVLRSMNDPAQIAPSMSLALLTTAYGAGLGALVFTPLAGRLEHHNTVFLQTHKQLVAKIGILLAREERNLDGAHTPTSGDAP